MRIAFHIDQLDVRGTTVALYDYAHYNELILHNQSVVIVPTSGLLKSDIEAIERVTKRFRVLLYDKNSIDTVLENEKIDLLYCIKYGKNDGVFSIKVKTVVHCVFDMSDPHGNVYAGVSQSLAKKYNSSLFVPHMIGLCPSTDPNDNLRSVLGIPPTARVFGRYGGMDTFDIPFCWNVINRIVSTFTDIYFLFINTPKRVIHKNVIHLNKITTEKEKNRFIHTTNAHLECGTLGHSFGLAIGEFSVNNKPIIAYKSPLLWNTAHLDILGDRGLYFTNEQSFYNLLTRFDPNTFKNKDLNCYKEYTPVKVMEKFKKVFLE